MERWMPSTKQNPARHIIFTTFPITDFYAFLPWTCPEFFCPTKNAFLFSFLHLAFCVAFLSIPRLSWFICPVHTLYSAKFSFYVHCELYKRHCSMFVFKYSLRETSCIFDTEIDWPHANSILTVVYDTTTLYSWVFILINLVN